MDGIADSSSNNTLLVNFRVPDGETWTLDQFDWEHIEWDESSKSPEQQWTGLELLIHEDVAGAVGRVLDTLQFDSSKEVGTGQNYTIPQEDGSNEYYPIMRSTFMFASSLVLLSGVYWIEVGVLEPGAQASLTGLLGAEDGLFGEPRAVQENESIINPNLNFTLSGTKCLAGSVSELTSIENMSF